MRKYIYDTLANNWLKECDSIYCISDPHFSDLDAYKLRFPTTFQPGTEYMHNSLVEKLDEKQIKNINSKAGKNACLIILGDVGNLECVKKLKARYKVLIMGNHEKGASNYKKEIYHDIKFCNEFPKNFIPENHGYKVIDPTPFGNLYDKVTTNGLFDEVYEGPLMVNDRLILSHEPIFPTLPFMFNIHGHVHNLHYQGDDHHLNLCAEAIDYMPFNLISALKKGLLKKIESIHRLTINNATKRKNRKK